MIILDTNVLSEILRERPDPNVMDWFARQSHAALFTTSITRAEMLYGVFLLPQGKRKTEKTAAVMAVFNTDLRGKILGFDNEAADCYGQIAALRKQSGKPISQFDAMIAGITQSRGARLATRNLKDFVDCGIERVNPWAGEA